MLFLYFESGGVWRVGTARNIATKNRKRRSASERACEKKPDKKGGRGKKRKRKGKGERDKREREKKRKRELQKENPESKEGAREG